MQIHTAHLVLEDGTVFTGRSAGAPGVGAGEACFTTAMAGYEEAISDLVGWIREGRLRYREDMLKGMEAAPGSIKTLHSGANSGKLVIRL